MRIYIYIYAYMRHRQILGTDRVQIQRSIERRADVKLAGPGHVTCTMRLHSGSHMSASSFPSSHLTQISRSRPQGVVPSTLMKPRRKGDYAR